MRTRGFTLAELVIGMALMVMMVLSAMTILISSLRSYERSTNDVDLTEKSGIAMQRVVEDIRSAVSVSIADSGKTLNFELPKYSTTNDSVTGEKEVVEPIVTDGVARSYKIQNGTLVNSAGKVLVRNVTDKDPDAQSSQYNQTYSPFSVTTIGSRRAITVNLITKKTVNGGDRWKRFKTTVIIQNSR